MSNTSRPPSAVRRRCTAWILAAGLALMLAMADAQAGPERVAVTLLKALLERLASVRTPVEATERLLAQGQDDLARTYLNALAEPHLDDADAVVRAYAKALRRESDAIGPTNGLHLSTQPLNARAVHTERAAYALGASPDQAPVLRALSDAGSTMHWIDFVTVDVQRFGRDFRQGFDRPDQTLDALRGTHDDLLQAWRSVPRERRVFLIGSGADAPAAQALRQRLRGDGYEVFFYDFCRAGGRPLCPSPAVGAFFASSGQTLVLETGRAAASGYIRLEVAVAQRLRGQRPPFMVLSSDDVRRAGEGSGRAAAFAGWRYALTQARSPGSSESEPSGPNRR
jgi:hypothetical protein